MRKRERRRRRAETGRIAIDDGGGRALLNVWFEEKEEWAKREGV